jgi:broad specificity phosphatase PhoE
MTTFLLLRHGETDAVGKSIMGWAPGWHLNANGRRQVEALATRLARAQLRTVYTSPLERAVETAEAVARPHAIEPRRDEEFGEFRMGDWQGIEIAKLDEREDWRRFNTFRAGTRAPHGELMLETQTRMVRRLQALASEHAGETVAIVSHADPLRALIVYYLGMPLDLMFRLEISPASLSVLELSDWNARFLCINSTEEIDYVGNHPGSR